MISTTKKTHTHNCKLQLLGCIYRYMVPHGYLKFCLNSCAITGQVKTVDLQTGDPQPDLSVNSHCIQEVFYILYLYYSASQWLMLSTLIITFSGSKQLLSKWPSPWPTIDPENYATDTCTLYYAQCANCMRHIKYSLLPTNFIKGKHNG